MKKTAAIKIFCVAQNELEKWLKSQPEAVKRAVKLTAFKADENSHIMITEIPAVIAGTGTAVTNSPWQLAQLPFALPEGNYRLDEKNITADQATRIALGWQLGSYRYSAYRKPTRQPARLLPPAKADMKYVEHIAKAAYLARDLINAPAADMLPSNLAAAARKIAAEYKAEYGEIVGENLLRKNYPAIYTVGKASANAPRLVDIKWGNKKHPKLTLVGKGVCFDSGGLDIKSSSNMALMKKDMGGAAVTMALASLIMAYKLPVRLRVMLPMVENAISGNAYRTGDVIRTRKGISVEVGNTDAEGRLILCDAIAEADTEKPDMIIDCATLTGAARSALGTDIPALFSNNDALAADFQKTALQEGDAVWQLPLWEGYRGQLKSVVADTNSASASAYGGAITAALFLKSFVENCPNWLHIDMMAWNLTTRPGRPEGGEAMTIRALFKFLMDRYK